MYSSLLSSEMGLYISSLMTMSLMIMALLGAPGVLIFKG